MLAHQIDTLEFLTDDEKLAVAEIKQGVQKLVGERLRGVYLFGSKARGDYDPESDVDLAILVEGLDRKTKDNILDTVGNAEIRYVVVISSFVLSWKDFTDLRDRERRIAFDIEHEGIRL